MITKLKYLKNYFQRDILPAAGVTIGKILYTAKNVTGRRKQYVIDLDANNMDITTINASPADVTTMPGAIVEINNTLAPQTDKTLYVFAGNTMLVIVATANTVTVTLQDGIDGLVAAIANVLANDTINAVAATTLNVDLTVVTSDAELTLNPDGSVDLAAATAPGDYTLTYKIADKNEPTNYATASVTVTVDVA